MSDNIVNYMMRA